MPNTVKVLIMDPEALGRRLLSHALNGLPDIEVTGAAAGLNIGLTRLANTAVDLVLLDAGMDNGGIQAVCKAIFSASPQVSIVILGTAAKAGDGAILEALETGALDYLRKPAGDDETSLREFRMQIATIIGILRMRLSVRPKARQGRQADALRPPPKPPDLTGPEPVCKPAATAITTTGRGHLHRIDIVVVATSTGGPNALLDVIPRLPADLNVPVLLVQHMPPQMTATLATRLDARSVLSVKESADGDKITPNTIFLAPGGRHMVVKRLAGGFERIIHLTDDPPENSVRPAADVLFRAVAEAYDGNILAVIMTGMGCDGRDGVALMKQKGCFCLTQTEKTCVVYGMPMAVDKAGLSDEQVPLSKIAARITDIVFHGPPRAPRTPIG